MVIKSISIKNPGKRSGARLTKPRRKNKSVDSPRMVEKVILVALGFAAVFWVFQSVVDVVLFQEGSLVEQLLTPGLHDIWMRTLVICTLIMFGVYAQSILAERKRAQDELAYMAIHDPLTGLPNRVLFNDRLTLALAGTDRSQRKLAVMLLDLDRFKDANDMLGHHMGDQVLRGVGNRLAALVRKSDTVARWGGDEFILLAPDMARVEDAAKIAQSILEAFRKPFVFGNQEFDITVSIGIASYPDDGEDAETLIKNADVAMYRAKENGGNRVEAPSRKPEPKVKQMQRPQVSSEVS
ncbi:MAG: GGDEF domain-containing protein [Dehalococcoidia bacterium]|nr:GGDEF domain-containing protein [Dehalococcoidia bacterium]